ncbi:KR domain-containing protein [Streptomyces cocklensis]|jgi:NAD(P)-dependent dehydrogenase (short-subunit alcohol dehydrogenase family)|uniref:Ketoreductase (KR) domain-containing protein n=1 Tax=Actinacidiphila cocklensis TaxID=887465 RepID=A0A9W4DSZ2_9ACTN|nr:KR domain-containing protein [Actinacidiphila cocklensis]MDD1059867.1 KR domain-containing protein [Actinacidiphila cocklensis]WSX72735.1 KR domain-containing protein [Streptomyces sp. NBC_00899]WSX81197.1 KR domain-containing protein [Streptomyces sp. NBC_00899]CAG6397167.1 hypothetical protein SCOCK_50216 [Actinacidiphila cocklensis]
MSHTHRTVLVTGATDGLGRVLAHALAVHGDTLILHGRSARKDARHAQFVPRGVTPPVT